MVDHIQRVAGRYPQIRSWDVVNETVDADTGELRETPLSRAMGQSVLDVAFHAAREAAPQAQLVYNDYMSWEAGHEKHRAGVLRLLEGFRLEHFEACTGLPRTAIARPLAAATARGWLEERDGRILPTALGGRFGNDVIQLFMDEDD